MVELMTWTELRDAVKAGSTTIILPVGGVEQSGPAVALGKHDIRAHVLSEAIARRLGRTLVAPVIAYVPEGEIDPPTEHMRFPGTISVPPDVFRKTVESAARSFGRHGFRDIVLIGEHGGYQRDLAAVADHLNRLWAHTPMRAHYIGEYYRAATTDFADLLRSRGYSPQEIGTHAGVADTSLTWAVDPALVRMELLKRGTGLTAENGVYGDPRRSSRELGEAGVEEIIRRTVEAVRARLGSR